MAARRERERRRPTAERTYRFASPESALEAEEALGETAPAPVDAEAAARALDAATRRSRSARGSAVAGQPSATLVRGAKPGVVHQSFAAFQAEYAYVLGDLRRVAVVIGSILVALIVLYFVLPH
jgi:hypothetical protein